jgi:hypothetical protein
MPCKCKGKYHIIPKYFISAEEIHYILSSRGLLKAFISNAFNSCIVMYRKEMREKKNFNLKIA